MIERLAAVNWGWVSTALLAGIIIGIIGTSLYFKRWRKSAISVINTYKARAERLEKAWNAKQTIETPGTIERGGNK